MGWVAGKILWSCDQILRKEWVLELGMIEDYIFLSLSVKVHLYKVTSEKKLLCE